MSLSSEERDLIIEHIADFAHNMFESADNEQRLHKELDRFLNFFCRALEAAKRDARHDALMTSTN